MFGWNILRLCYSLHRPTENGVNIFLNIVTQQQSMYEVFSVSKVPNSLILFKKPFYFLVIF